MNIRKIAWVAALAGVAMMIPPARAQDGGEDGKILIRPTYVEGRTLRYHLNAGGATAWTPAQTALGWSKAATDFTFGLRAKVVRESGACTFAVVGENLRSAASSHKGSSLVSATPEKFTLQVNGKSFTTREHNPLNKETTVTLGPLGTYRFGTGAAPLAVFLLPNVDKIFWTLLTTAPVGKVSPGDAWSKEFTLPVPGGQGRPLHVTGKWKVIGWETYRGQKVLAMALAGELALEDSTVILKNGDRAHVQTGSYKAEGKVLWDIEHGVLCSVAAKQKILIKSDRPTFRALRSEHTATLKFLGVGK
jgi:hypothetical protein